MLDGKIFHVELNTGEEGLYIHIYIYIYISVKLITKLAKIKKMLLCRVYVAK